MSDHFFFYVSHSSAFRPNLIDRLGNVFPRQFFAFGADSGGKRAKQDLISGLYLRNQHLHLAFTKVIFSSFLHVLLSPNERTTAGLFIRISILNEGGDWVERRARACALNFTLIGMYKENLREIVLTQGLIHPDLFVRSSFPDFGVRKVLVRNPRKSLYMRPQVFFGQWRNCIGAYFRSIAPSIICAGTRPCFSPTRLSRRKCSGACLLRGKFSFAPCAN